MQCLRTLLLLAGVLLMPISVMADDTAGATQVVAESVGHEPMLNLNAFESGVTLTDEELGSHRARENIEIREITLNNQDQDGDVTDNVAIGTTNGDNLINGEAFSNSAGFLSTVQNSGNNVLIQNSTIINVSVATATE